MIGVAGWCEPRHEIELDSLLDGGSQSSTSRRFMQFFDRILKGADLSNDLAYMQPCLLVGFSSHSIQDSHIRVFNVSSLINQHEKG